MSLGQVGRPRERDHWSLTACTLVAECVRQERGQIEGVTRHTLQHRVGCMNNACTHTHTSGTLLTWEKSRISDGEDGNSFVPRQRIHPLLLNANVTLQLFRFLRVKKNQLNFISLTGMCSYQRRILSLWIHMFYFWIHKKIIKQKIEIINSKAVVKTHPWGTWKGHSALQPLIEGDTWQTEEQRLSLHPMDHLTPDCTAPSPAVLSAFTTLDAFQ